MLSDRYYKLRFSPTTSDLLYVVAIQEKGRFQATCLTGSLEPYDVLVRCVQRAQRQHRQTYVVTAHAQVWNKPDIPIVAHHTKTELLESTIRS